MEFNLTLGTAVLARTPGTVRAMLSGLGNEWVEATEGPHSWSPSVIVGHLVYGERTDWIPRAEIILSDGTERRFEPYDRFAQFTESRGKSLGDLLDEFSSLREANLARVAQWQLTEAQLARVGEHPSFGTVSLRQLLATWVTNDLGTLRRSHG